MTNGFEQLNFLQKASAKREVLWWEDEDVFYRTFSNANETKFEVFRSAHFDALKLKIWKKFLKRRMVIRSHLENILN